MSDPRPKAESGIRIMCPTLTCRKILAVPGAARGKTVRCKYCNASIRIPGRKDAAPSKPENPGAAAA